jgi:large subunit ribosomal protein L21
MSETTATKTASKAKKASAKTVSLPRTSAKTAAALAFPYAVIRAGGKQYRVAKGDMLLVEKLEIEVGSQWTADEVLFVARSPGQFEIGKPLVKGAKVNFEVLQQTLGKKVLIRHHRRRQNSQKTLGHRQPLTRILVKDITA